MTDVLDPTPAHLLFFSLLIAAAAGIGYTMGGRLGLFGSAVFAGIIGFAAGLYAEGEEASPVAIAVVAGGLTAVTLVFLPLSLTWGTAVFLVGFAVGMRTERH